MICACLCCSRGRPGSPKLEAKAADPGVTGLCEDGYRPWSASPMMHAISAIMATCRRPRTDCNDGLICAAASAELLARARPWRSRITV